VKIRETADFQNQSDITASTRRRKLVWRISAIAVIVAVVAGVLVGIHVVSSSSGDVKDRAIGANVTVSGANVPSSMKAVTIPAQPKFIAGFTPLGSTIDITPSGGLPAPVTLRFKLDTPLSGTAIVFIGTSESVNGPWTLMKPTISQGGLYATVQATHLSLFHFVQIDPSGIINFFKDTIGGLTSDLFTTASPPNCNPDWYKESQAQRDNYTIGSTSKSGKSALYWCFGKEGSQRILKIVNRMRYPLDISHPGFTFMRTSGPHLQLDAEQLAQLGVGDDLILFPFEEADFSVNLPPGVDATLTSESSPLTEGLGFFESALTVVLAIVAAVEKVVVEVSETAVTIFEDGERTTVVISSSKMTIQLVDALSYIINKFLDFKDCFNTFAALQSTRNFGAFVGSFLGSCIKDHVKDGIKALVQGLGVVAAFAITAAVSLILSFGAVISYVIGFGNDWNDSQQDAARYNIEVSRTRTPITQPPTPPPTVTPIPPQHHAVNAYDNYGQSNLAGHAMCRGNPDNSLSMPGGTGTQTFTVPAGVATLSSAKVQIDPASVTAHMSIAVNGAVKATTSAAAVGDTRFNFGPISVHPGDTVKLSITFTATYGKIITLYTVGNPGGKFTASNSCPDGAPNFSTTTSGLRAVVSGMS
jgi:hypothetical protein